MPRTPAPPSLRASVRSLAIAAVAVTAMGVAHDAPTRRTAAAPCAARGGRVDVPRPGLFGFRTAFRCDLPAPAPHAPEVRA